jgi:DNA-binding transcriptional regulator YhcF (GntR family)
VSDASKASDRLKSGLCQGVCREETELNRAITPASRYSFPLAPTQCIVDKMRHPTRTSLSRRQAQKQPRQQLDSELPLDVEIANRLIREIIALKLQPGSWLREQEIAERFGVSRSPVREALRHIAKQGFVEMHPWRGAQLVELSGETTVHVFDMLEALYGVVAKHAAQSMPDEQLPKLRSYLKLVDQVAKTGVTMQERVRLSFEIGRFIGKWGTTTKTYEVFTHVGNLAMWQHRFMQTEDVFARRSKGSSLCDGVRYRNARFGARRMGRARDR